MLWHWLQLGLCLVHVRVVGFSERCTARLCDCGEVIHMLRGCFLSECICTFLCHPRVATFYVEDHALRSLRGYRERILSQKGRGCICGHGFHRVPIDSIKIFFESIPLSVTVIPHQTWSANLFLDLGYIQSQQIALVDDLRQDFGSHGTGHRAKGKIEQLVSTGRFSHVFVNVME